MKANSSNFIERARHGGRTTSGQVIEFEDGSRLMIFATVKNPPDTQPVKYEIPYNGKTIEVEDETKELWDLAAQSSAFLALTDIDEMLSESVEIAQDEDESDDWDCPYGRI